MRRENAGCVTWRSWAERLKLRVSARLTKSSSHLVSMARIIGPRTAHPFRLALSVGEHPAPKADAFDCKIGQARPPLARFVQGPRRTTPAGLPSDASSLYVRLPALAPPCLPNPHPG